jgi:hypothetical protein
MWAVTASLFFQILASEKCNTLSCGAETSYFLLPICTVSHEMEVLRLEFEAGINTVM